jgi:hypothetical protein
MANLPIYSNLTYVGNKITTAPKMWSVETIYELFDAKKLISVTEFLQRDLLEALWKANDYLNCKQYIASVYKNTHSFDLFSVVKLQKLIEVVKLNMGIEKNSGKLSEYNKLFIELEEYEKTGVEYVSLDGQSRLMLGIHWYMINNFSLNDCETDVELFVDGKPSNCLETTTFSNLPKSVRDLFNSIKIPIIIVTDFSKLSDLVEALVNKQKGFNWTWFQIAKQSERFGIFAINLINKTPKSFKENWKNNLTKLSNDYKYYVDGHQLFLVVVSYFLQFGHFPSKDKIKFLFKDNSGLPISNTAVDCLLAYTNEYFKALGNTKTTMTPLMNYIFFRQLISGKKFDSDFVKKVKLPGNYNIKKDKDFADYFIKLHHTLYNNKNRHDASWITDANGIKTKSATGYNKSCGRQDDENIYRRINTFIKYFDFEMLIKSGIIEEVENINMPSQIDVAIYNDWEDVNGNPINISDLPKLDRSHYDASGDNGSNELNNLGLEHFSPNRSRGKKKLEKV